MKLLNIFKIKPANKREQWFWFVGVYIISLISIAAVSFVLQCLVPGSH